MSNRKIFTIDYRDTIETNYRLIIETIEILKNHVENKWNITHVWPFKR